MTMKKSIHLHRPATNEEIRVTLDGEGHSFIVGRSKECDHTLSGNPMISRQHIEFTVKGGNCYVEDLGSKFLTFLDDKQVKEPVELKDGQILKLANELFTVEIREQDAKTATAEGPCCPICHSPVAVGEKFCDACGSFLG